LLGNSGLFVHGNPLAESLARYAEIFQSVAVRGSLPENAPSHCWEITDFSDRMHLDLGLKVALFLCPPSANDAMVVDQLIEADGVLITPGYFPRLKQDLPHRTILRIDPSQAYRGQVARWTTISTMVTGTRSARLAVAE
jgi:hypothetical protein